MYSTQTEADCRALPLSSLSSADRRRSRSARGAERNESSAIGSSDNPASTAPADPPYAVLATLTRYRLRNLCRKTLSARVSRYADEHQRYLSTNGKFTLTSESWTVTASERPICDVRCVLIRGSKNTIINTWAFPYHPETNPVYAAELIAFGGLPRLGFLDVQVPGMRPRLAEHVHSHVAETTRDFPHLRIQEEPPEWAIAATTGNYLFTREGQPSLYDSVSTAYLRLLDSYIDLISVSERHCSESPVDHDAFDQLREYQIHHMEHSPGKVFLSKLFGESWTDSFMNQFLFASPGGLA